MTRRMIIATLICVVLGAGVYWFQVNVVMRDLKAQIDQNELADFRAHFILQEDRLRNHEALMGRMLLFLEDAKGMQMDTCDLKPDFLKRSTSLRITIADMEAIRAAGEAGKAFDLPKGARNEMLTSAFWEYIPPADSAHVPTSKRKEWMKEVIAFGEDAFAFQNQVEELWILDPQNRQGETGWNGWAYRFDMQRMEVTCVQWVSHDMEISGLQTPAEP